MILQPDGKPLLSKLMIKYPPELDVTQLQKILRAHWKVYLAEKPSLELCKSLIMLRDINISGRINMLDIPVLMHMLQFWKVIINNNCNIMINTILQDIAESWSRTGLRKYIYIPTVSL